MKQNNESRTYTVTFENKFGTLNSILLSADCKRMAMKSAMEEMKTIDDGTQFIPIDIQLTDNSNMTINVEECI